MAHAEGRQAEYTGGCQCGAVRYTLYAEPANASICHRRMCQKAFGSFFAPLAGVSIDDCACTRGNLSIFRSSDAVERGFCKDCGTPLTFRYVNGGDLHGVVNEIDVAIGSLDQPERVKPTIQYGVENKLAWVDDLPQLPSETTEGSTSGAVLATIRSSSRQHPDHDTETWPPKI